MFYDKFCTTISHGRPRQRCPATTSPPMMCLTASASHTGHGTDSRCRTPRLTCTTLIGPNFEPGRRLHIDHCGGSTLPAEGVDPANGAVLIQLLNSRIVGYPEVIIGRALPGGFVRGVWA